MELKGNTNKELYEEWPSANMKSFFAPNSAIHYITLLSATTSKWTACIYEAQSKTGPLELKQLGKETLSWWSFFYLIN